MEISRIFKTMSKITQPVPLVSIPIGLVNIFIKAVVLPMVGNPRNDYLKFVAKKTWGEALSAPIPFVGGIVFCVLKLQKQSRAKF